MGDIATGETATCGTSIPAAIQIDSSIIFSRIKQLEAVSLGHPILPLSRLPPIPDKTDAAAYAEFQLKIDVLASFFLQSTRTRKTLFSSFLDVASSPPISHLTPARRHSSLLCGLGVAP